MEVAEPSRILPPLEFFSAISAQFPTTGSESFYAERSVDYSYRKGVYPMSMGIRLGRRLLTLSLSFNVAVPALNPPASSASTIQNSSDEEPGDESSVLLGGIYIGGRRR